MRASSRCGARARRCRDAIVAAALLLAVAAPAAAQCGAQTFDVQVILSCPVPDGVKGFSIEIPRGTDFEMVAIARDAATGRWLGRAQAPVRLGVDTLGRTELPGRRVQCGVRATTSPDFPTRCVAAFRVACDVLWKLVVASNPDKLEFRYQLVPKVYCGSAPPAEKNATAEKSLDFVALRDQVLISMNVKDAWYRVAVTQQLLSEGDVRFWELDPKPTTETANNNGYNRSTELTKKAMTKDTKATPEADLIFRKGNP